MTSVSRILLLVAASAVGASCSSGDKPSNPDGGGSGGAGGTGGIGGAGAHPASAFCYYNINSTVMIGALDTSQCAATFDAQVAKAPVCDTGAGPGQDVRSVRSGDCGPYKIWRTARDGSLPLVIDCVYDSSGNNLVETRFCTDTGCMCGGQDLDLSHCAGGTGLGADSCAVTDGSAGN